MRFRNLLLLGAIGSAVYFRKDLKRSWNLVTGASKVLKAGDTETQGSPTRTGTPTSTMAP